MEDKQLITKLALEFAANYHQMDVADRKIIACALDLAMKPLVTVESNLIYKGESRVESVVQIGAVGEKQLEIIDVTATQRGMRVKVL